MTAELFNLLEKHLPDVPILRNKNGVAKKGQKRQNTFQLLFGCMFAPEFMIKSLLFVLPANVSGYL